MKTVSKTDDSRLDDLRSNSRAGPESPVKSASRADAPPRDGAPPARSPEVVRQVTLPNGHAVTIRPLHPEDAAIERDFVHDLSDQSRYLRFLHAIRELTPEMLVRFTQIDVAREVALIAVEATGQGAREVGVARCVTLPDGSTCEFAIAVADEWQGSGLARELMQSLITAARDRGLAVMQGVRLRTNVRMGRLARSLGFESAMDDDDRTLIRMRLDLQHTDGQPGPGGVRRVTAAASAPVGFAAT